MINAIALAQTRTERGLSQRKLARLVGLNFQAIRRLEAGGDDGNLTLRDYAKICQTLEVAPGSLLRNPDQPLREDRRVGDGSETQELTLGQARLLRRIQRDGDVRRALTTDERSLILPTLMRLGLVRATHSGGLRLASEANSNLGSPEEKARMA